MFSTGVEIDTQIALADTTQYASRSPGPASVDMILRVITGIANTPVLTVLHKTQSGIIFQCSDILAWCADLIFRRGIQGSYSGLVFCQPGLVFGLGNPYSLVFVRGILTRVQSLNIKNI